MKLAVLASCFSGNVGDLYILRSVTEFIANREADVVLDIFPYPKRFDTRVACAEQLELPPCVKILPHRFAIRSLVDQASRKYAFVSRYVDRFYFTPAGRVFRSKYAPLPTAEYDGLISLGGEMDTPYSFFDIHDYVRNLYRDRSMPFVYGPISIKPEQRHVSFLKEIFSSVDLIGIRDPSTYKWLIEQGIDNIKLVPDCAFLSWKGAAGNILKRKRIGLCLHTSWTGRYEKARGLVMEAHRAAKKMDSELVIYPTNMLEDYQLFRKLVPDFRNYEGLVFAFPNTSKDFIQLSNSLDLVISDRLHALLVGMLHGANVLPIRSRHKVIGYVEYMGLQHSIGPDDGEKLIFENILNASDDADLSENLEKFCKNANREVSKFYIEQLAMQKY